MKFDTFIGRFYRRFEFFLAMTTFHSSIRLLDISLTYANIYCHYYKHAKYRTGVFRLVLRQKQSEIEGQRRSDREGERKRERGRKVGKNEK